MWTFRPTFEREITDYAPPTFVNSLWPCIKRIMTILTCCGCVLVFGVQARSENMKIEVRCRKWKVWSLDLKMQTSIGIYPLVCNCVASLQFVHASCHSAVSKFHFIKHLTHLHAHIPTNIQQVTQLSNCPNIFFLSARNICCLTTLMRDPLW